MGFTDDDLRLLEVDLLENQNKYQVIKGTGGLRKCRVKLRNKGKNGEARAGLTQKLFAAFCRCNVYDNSNTIIKRILKKRKNENFYNETKFGTNEKNRTYWRYQYGA